ncbi:hypothetical protein [Nocardia altamirensis]|uniref:hypothetical protein n=1 Tax=Nocardia altamirensis TaxID=472158 RepID=UPI00114CA254|nr:hypothetical protein [Nocardia altamirensis]
MTRTLRSAALVALAMIVTTAVSPVAGADHDQRVTFSGKTLCDLGVNPKQEVEMTVEGAVNDAGQTISLTGAAGTVRLNSAVKSLFLLWGADSVGGAVGKLPVAASNATSATIDAAAGQALPFAKTKLDRDTPEILLNFPDQSTFGAGPFIRNGSGSVDFTLGAGWDFSVRLFNSAGQPIRDVPCRK